MHLRKPLLIVIVGPTAAGKSELAVRLARKFGGEIVSADSRQVYRGLDIGTGKVPGAWRTVRGRRFFVYRGIIHHCIDFVPPKKMYTVAEFKHSADLAIRDAAGRGRVPILTGGSGLWVDAVAFGLAFPAVPPNRALRGRLQKKSAGELWAMLKRIDPRRARTIEPENPRRLIRAIEIARAIGRVPELKRHSPYRVLWIGLNPAQSRLDRTIAAFAARIIRRGLVRETKTLLRRVGRNRLGEFGFEYRAALAYLAGGLSRSGLRARLTRDLQNYARRQMAWFRRNPAIRWASGPSHAERLVRAFLFAGNAVGNASTRRSIEVRLQ